MAAAPLMAPPAMDQQQPVQKTIIHRDTKGGRRLWYRLTVLQEPERARACGSGPKSTNDRRPVDPPPVVELRIFEGDDLEHSKDITFNYKGNFFLFATLEHARPMAHGRVNTPAATSPPVLTGSFVSGMAYLDRPSEAGYFLFPDLSVRHEGRYKLVFNLYEQTKDDKDKSPDDSKAPSMDDDESFDWRLQLESRAFSVFSAKKFPGLTESTMLSRTISEQGCRVRIRRDIRMRRRDGKPAGGNDYESQQPEGYERHQRTRTQTPEIKPDVYRARSLSNASVDRATPSYPDQRRPSGSEYPQPPPHPPQYAGAPQTPTSGGGYLQFGQSSTSQYAPPPPPQQYPGPPQQQPQSSPVTPHQSYPPPPNRSYSHPAPPAQYPASTAPAQNPPQPMGYASERALPSQSYQYPPPPPTPRDRYDDTRRPSVGYSQHNHYPADRDYQKVVPRPADGGNAAPGIPPFKNTLPPIQLPPITAPPGNTRKRAYDESFHGAATNQSLSNGARQVDAHHQPAGSHHHIDNDPNHPYLYYQRADGSKSWKLNPPTS